MRRALLLVLCVLTAASTGFCAEATSEGAQSLADTFHRYLGPPRAGQADFVRVVPTGDAYNVSLDVKEFLRPLEAVDLTIGSAELSFRAEPLADGTWHVSDMQLPTPLTVRVKDETLTYRFEGVTFDGVYDPALAAFTRFDETIGGMTVDGDGPGGQGTGRYDAQHVTGTAVASGTGAADVTVAQTVDGFSMHQSVPMPPAAGAETPTQQFELSYSGGASGGEAAITGLKAPKLLELWAYAVAHLQPGAAPVDGSEIKTLLTDLLPIFRQLDETGGVHALKVQTPMGEFGLQDLEGSLALSGIVSSSVLRMGMKVAGPTYPAALVPGWATQLVPDSLQWNVDASGLDLDATARALIDKIDVSKKPWVDDDAWSTAAHLAIPEGGIEVKLGPTSIHGPVLDIEAEGSMILTGAESSGSFNVTVKGLDAAIALLKDADDPMAGQVLASFTLAQSWGRQTSDGTTYYGIEIKSDGEITVNGQMVKPAAGKAL